MGRHNMASTGSRPEVTSARVLGRLALGRVRRCLIGVGGTAVSVLVVTGCSGQSSPGVATAVTTSSGAQPSISATMPVGGVQAELAAYIEHQRSWVRCMHEHGVDVPDPDKYGTIRMTERPPEKAQMACKPLKVAVPASVERLALPPLTAAEKKIKQDYSRCMQTHGAPDFPDPGPDGHFLDTPWDQASAGAVQAGKVCAPIIGDPVPTGPGIG